MSRWWLLVSLPLALLAAGTIAWTVRGLVRKVRQSVVTSVPLHPAQRIAFDQPGDYALSFETSIGRGHLMRRGVGRLAGLGFTLVNDRGVAIDARAPLSQTQVSSFSRTRLEVARVTVPAAGTYTLHVTAPNVTGSAAEQASDAIVVSRPIGGWIVLYVLTFIVLGGALIGAIVVTGLAWSGRGLGPSSP